MKMSKKRIDFLGENEEVDHVLSTENTSFIITNKRILIDRSDPDRKIYLYDEIDYKHITYVQSLTKESQDHRYLGVLGLIVGIALIAYPYLYGKTDYYALIGVGFFLIIAGLILLFVSPKIESKLLIESSGAQKERTYEIDASVEEMQLLMTKINENRTKYTTNNKKIKSEEFI